MKKKQFIIILFFISTYCCAQKDSSKQSNSIFIHHFKSDTAKYIQYIIANKERYIGKNLIVLLRELELNILSYTYSGNFSNKNYSNWITLWFYEGKKISYLRNLNQKPTNLIIIWKEPLSSKKDNQILKNSKGNWTQEAKDYYSWPIVKDITTTNYR